MQKPSFPQKGRNFRKFNFFAFWRTGDPAEQVALRRAQLAAAERAACDSWLWLCSINRVKVEFPAQMDTVFINVLFNRSAAFDSLTKLDESRCNLGSRKTFPIRLQYVFWLKLAFKRCIDRQKIWKWNRELTWRRFCPIMGEEVSGGRFSAQRSSQKRRTSFFCRTIILLNKFTSRSIQTNSSVPSATPTYYSTALSVISLPATPMTYGTLQKWPIPQ